MNEILETLMAAFTMPSDGDAEENTLDFDALFKSVQKGVAKSSKTKKGSKPFKGGSKKSNSKKSESKKASQAATDSQNKSGATMRAEALEGDSEALEALMLVQYF